MQMLANLTPLLMTSKIFGVVVTRGSLLRSTALISCSNLIRRCCYTAMHALRQRQAAPQADRRKRPLIGHCRRLIVHASSSDNYHTHSSWQQLQWHDAAEKAGGTVTLTTQCSLDRWPSVHRLLHSWDGPVSVAVYIPAPLGTQEADACVQLLKDRLAKLPLPQPQHTSPAASSAGPIIGTATRHAGSVTGADRVHRRSGQAPGEYASRSSRCSASDVVGVSQLQGTTHLPHAPSLCVSLLYANHHAKEGFSTLQQYLHDAPVKQAACHSAAAGCQEPGRQQESTGPEAPDTTARGMTSTGASANSTSTSTNNSASTSVSSTPGGASTLLPSNPTPPLLEPQYDQLYPINALRNLALEAATTPLVFPLDADFVPSSGAAGQAELLMTLLAEGTETGVTPPGRCMLVLPAFELRRNWSAAMQSPTPEAEEGQRHLQHLQQQLQQRQQQETSTSAGAQQHFQWIPRTKSELIEAWGQGTVDKFHCGKWAPLQESIDYSSWLQRGASSTSSSSSSSSSSSTHAKSVSRDMVTVSELADQAPYHEFWEPLGIVMRSAMPQYDPRFKGYGLNKVQHAYHLASLGFTFLVLRRHFVVTAPHPRSPSFNAAFGSSADPAHRQRVEKLYQIFKTELQWGGA